MSHLPENDPPKAEALSISLSFIQQFFILVTVEASDENLLLRGAAPIQSKRRLESRVQKKSFGKINMQQSHLFFLCFSSALQIHSSSSNTLKHPISPSSCHTSALLKMYQEQEKWQPW
jgi:hypothetical protein